MFRFACDRKLRDTIISFADNSRHASLWAAISTDAAGAPFQRFRSLSPGRQRAGPSALSGDTTAWSNRRDL